MRKIALFIQTLYRNTYVNESRKSSIYTITAFILSSCIAIIAISGRPSGAKIYSLLLDYVVAFALNTLLFVLFTLIISMLFVLCRVRIARIALSSLLYTGIGYGVLMYTVDAGAIFSVIAGLIMFITSIIIGFIFHLLYTYTNRLIIFISILLFFGGAYFIFTDFSTFESNEKGSYDVQFFTYGSGKDPYREDFGDKVTEKTEPIDGSDLITKWSDKRTKFWEFDPADLPLNGRVFMPDGEGPFPTILMVHGNHTMEKFSTGGYDYLGEFLASHGYIFISVDEDFINYSNITGQPNDNYTVRTWMLLQHLVQIKQFNENKNSNFFNKVDLDNIALAGHSRGGQAAAMGADYEQFIEDEYLKEQLQDVHIKAVAAISPTDKAINGEKPALNNVAYFVMHGAQDADVYNFRGDQQFYRTRGEEDHFLRASLYIEGANHVHFNNDWGNYDLAMPKGMFLNTFELISRSEQQTIAAHYLLAYLNEVFHEENSLTELMNNKDESLPDIQYREKNLSSTYEPIVNYHRDQEIVGELNNFTKTEVKRPKNRSGDVHPNQVAHLQWADKQPTYKIPLHFFDYVDGNHIVLSIANNEPKENIAVELSFIVEGETKETYTETLSPAIEINQTPFGLLDEFYRDGKYEVKSEPIFETIKLPIDDISFSALDEIALQIEFTGKNGNVFLEEIGIE